MGTSGEAKSGEAKGGELGTSNCCLVIDMWVVLQYIGWLWCSRPRRSLAHWLTEVVISQRLKA